MHYRAEIDGLRAVAVLPVIFFHAGFSAFAGGFVGVDIFFVISGYLITSIILAEHQADVFTLRGFYLRRARRILPALFVVMLACLPFAWRWLLPEDMKDFSQSILATVGFISNFFFWLKTGYFDIDAALKPLLHNWSLAVEEQFYWVYPFLFIVLLKSPSKSRWITLIAIAVASLWIAQVGSVHLQTANFFLFPSRFWELVIGAMLAFSSLSQGGHPLCQQRYPLLHQLLGLLGISLIGYAIVFFTEVTPYPSLYTLIPTLGTGLVIAFAKRGTWVGEFLSWRPLVNIGLISYSAYLWHQPLLAFARYRVISPLSTPLIFLLIFCTFALAYLTWRVVETPFRSKYRFSAPRFLSLAGVVAMILVGFGLAGHRTNGFVNGRSVGDVPGDYLKTAQVSKKINIGIDGKLCISDGPSICQVTTFPASEQKILLLGDSHSADFTNQFRDYAHAHQINAWQMSITGCALLQTQLIASPSCNLAKEIVQQRVKNHDFDRIIIVGNYFSHTLANPVSSLAVDIDWITQAIEEMLQSGADVTFFIPRTNFNYSPMRAAAMGRLNLLNHTRDDANEEAWMKALNALRQYKNFHLFDQDAVLAQAGCGDTNCFNGHTKNLLPLYRDQSHLTNLGSQLLFDAYSRGN